MPCSLRSRVTRSSCLHFARCSPKSRTTCRSSTSPCASWPSWTNPSATRGSPPWSLSERQHYVLPVRCPLLQSLVVGFHSGQLRTLDRERVSSMDERPERNVAHGERFSR